MANQRRPRFDWDQPDGIDKKYRRMQERVEAKVRASSSAEAAALACEGEDLVTAAHAIQERFKLTDNQLVKVIYGDKKFYDERGREI